MKYLDENGASRLLEKIKAYADRKVAEVDLRGDGTVEGELHLNSGLVVDWISDPTATWEINQDGCIRCVDLNASGGVAGSLGSFETLDADSVTALSGKFDKVEIGEITNSYISPSVLLKVGEGGICSQGSIFSLTSVESVHVEADSATFKQLDVTKKTVITGDTTIDHITIPGYIGGINGIWDIDDSGYGNFDSISTKSGLSAYGPSEFYGETEFFDSVLIQGESKFYNTLLGYNNATLSWYIAKSGGAKFTRIVTLPQYYQFSDIDVEQLEEENIVPAVLELIQLGPGIQALDPGLIKVLGCNRVYAPEGYIRLGIGFQTELNSTIRGAKLTCDGMTLMTIPLSNAFKGFFEYCLPINTTNWNFNVKGTLCLEAITEIN